jgi:hypothetical protein
VKDLIKRIPIIGDLARRVYWRLVVTKQKPRPFAVAEKYWEDRYATGGNSGIGSYGKFADFKAEVINAFVAKQGVHSVIEFGCGDGNQLMLARYPKYVGLDVSETAISKCRGLFASDQTKLFDLMHRYSGKTADLTLSLDVIYHLVEDQVFENYMRALFAASNRYVIIYSSDCEENGVSEGTHVRHRKFSRWIRQNLTDWKLLEHIPNKYPYRGDYREGSIADFFIYERA